MTIRQPRAALLALAALGAALASSAAAQELRIGLRADPDILDPAQGGSVAGRVVFAALCDKLVDTTPEGGLRPQLATGWSWSDDGLALTMTLREDVTFHDGATFDAEAAKANLDRYRTADYSRRRTELKSVENVVAVDPTTLRLELSEPFAPLVAVLADRAGMMMSPAAFEEAGAAIGLAPVCSGPFRFVERIDGDSIRLARFADYRDPDSVHLDDVTYVTIPDDAVRVLSLRSGDLDLIERLAPTDMAAVEAAEDLSVVEGPSVAYDLISINIAHGPQADNPLGRDPRVRQAFERAIDRNVINQVVYEGAFVPSNQHEVPGGPYHVAAHPSPARDVEAAKSLLAEAGVPNPAFTLTVASSSTQQQIGQLIQAMAGEAGFDIDIQALESTTLAASSDAGDYQASLAIWSGRPDPDANVTPWAACDGFLNWGRFCDPELDAILAEARSATDEAERSALYERAVSVYLDALPHIILYHYTSLYGINDRVEGFTPYPDSLIRLQGVRKTEG